MLAGMGFLLLQKIIFVRFLIDFYFLSNPKEAPSKDGSLFR